MGLMVGLLLLPAALAGQARTTERTLPEVVTLDDAIRIARANNPTYLARANDEGVATWQVRQAYGNFLPSVTASGGASWTDAGVQRIGTLDFGAQSTEYYQSSYRLGFNWSLSGSTIYALSNARANARATDAGIAAAEFDLKTNVTLQYMTALRARDAEVVALDTWERAQQNFELVRTRVATGFVAGAEQTQAEVEVGRAEVAYLRAQRSAQLEKARLAQQMGVPLDGPLELVDTFTIFEPTWSQDELLGAALNENPSLRSFQATSQARGAGVRQAQSAYLPSISLSSGISGNSLQALNEDFVVASAQGSAESRVLNCERQNALEMGIPGGIPGWDLTDCSQFAYTPAQGQAALDRNAVFPFDFTRNPISVSLTISVPVFQGFGRKLQVEQAQAAAQDARYSLRAEELRLRAAVTQSHDELNSAFQAIQIEERNLDLARTRLEQARQRYAAGSTSIIELMDAETSLSTAERDHLDALYRFHQTLVALEAATGRTLRPEVGGADDDDDAGSEVSPVAYDLTR